MFIALSINAQTSDKLVVIPSLNDTLQKEKVNFYCSTFQMAWNNFKLFIGEDIKISDAADFSDKMNNGHDAKRYTPSKYALSYSGYCLEKDIKKFNSKLKRKYGEKFEPLGLVNKPNEILFATYLFQELKFRHKYQKISTYEDFTDYKGNISRVKAWGISPENTLKNNGEKLSKTIKLYQTDDGRQFAISLKTKSSKYEIILAEINPRIIMAENIALIDSIILSAKPIKHKNIILKVPALDMSAERDFNEIIGKDVENKGWDGWKISEAFQKNNFELNQEGAIIKSHAHIRMTKGISFCNTGNAYTIKFDKPFMIILREKGAKYPYVAIWMGNNYGMKKYPNDSTL
ncbi:MAG: hypothetical protein CVU05_03480 [Bacteroidetes bacterium HGW-Bacteroidetes-21]|nr:MAG: hypothetical protein CVU05_03480 [Bacteroidetes bacterium HGW-Bacteroidetes-21]